VHVRENNRQVRSLLATTEENIDSEFINAENKVHMYTSQSPVFYTPSERYYNVHVFTYAIIKGQQKFPFNVLMVGAL
jgi:hypothetical protein